MLFDVSDQLIAGLPLLLRATLNPGSFAFSEATELTVSASEGVEISGDMIQNGRIPIPAVVPYEKVEVVFTSLAKLTHDAPKLLPHTVKTVKK